MYYVRTYVRTYQWYVRSTPFSNQKVVTQHLISTKATTETVLREAMQALVRVQAHMLARIVVEIRAADIAVELEPQL